MDGSGALLGLPGVLPPPPVNNSGCGLFFRALEMLDYPPPVVYPPFDFCVFVRGVARRFPLCLLLEILPRPPPAADKGKSRLLCNNGKPARPCQPGRVRRLKDFDSLLYFDIFRLPEKPRISGVSGNGQGQKSGGSGQKSGGFRTKKRWL